jgi:hypothetical protein
MRNNIKIIISALLFSSIFTHAQIGLNTTTLSGNAALGFNRSTYSNYNVNNYFGKLNPSYGKFIGNKTLFTVQPNAGLERFEAIPSNMASKSTYNASILGLNTSIRHYFNPSSKFKLYGEGNLAIDARTFDYGDMDITRKMTVGTIGVAVGANYFLNKTIALNAQLGYKRDEILSGGRGVINTAQIGVNLENFIHAESEVGEGEELIAKGRKSIGGNIGLNIKDFGTTYQFKARYSQFVSKGLMIGGSVEAINTDFQGKTLKIETNVRYYVPLGKKLFIYPEAKLTYADLGVGRFYYELGVGMNYFIKKNVALDIDLLRLGGSQGQSNIFFGANVGLKYFLK